MPFASVLGAVVFTLGWIVLGAISPGYRLFDLIIDPYSPIAQPISGLGLGVTGPYMNAAFIVAGLLVATGAIASIGRLSASRLATAGLVLIAIMGVGMIVDGIFTLESVMLHLLGFVLAVPVLAIAFALLAIAVPRLRVLLIIGLVATLALFALFMVTFDPYSAGDNAGMSGLIQRVLVTVALATVSVVAIASARQRAVAATEPR
ncbi:MAG: DUF998 domain-containing protein [Pseudolysinimonas sp.]